MKFLFLEPFYGGSHKDFVDGLISHSRHKIDLVTLPARFWKWRMRGAALYFFQKIPSLSAYDGLIGSGLMSLSDLRSLCRGELPPTLIYFHENQFTYPLAPGETMDYQFGFTDITSALAADMVAFNSQTHQDAFFSKLTDFLNMMPEYRPHWVSEVLQKRTTVLYPGCHYSSSMPYPNRNQGEPPMIVWNHRWEFDKRPDLFYQALTNLRALGKEFRLTILGERYRKVPPAFRMIQETFKDCIEQYGFAASRETYYQWLSKGDIVISTADQENFGISIVEAIRHGCLPLLPNRLSYPEILPKIFHRDFLYGNFDDFVSKLAHMVSHLNAYDQSRKELSKFMKKFAWERQVLKFDQVIEHLPGIARNRSHCQISFSEHRS